jgi:hypothetical protein
MQLFLLFSTVRIEVDCFDFFYYFIATIWFITKFDVHKVQR